MSQIKLNPVRPVLKYVPAALLLVCGVASSCVHAQSITNIGVPAGGSFSGATAVSGNGSFVSATVDMQSAHRWTTSGLANIGSLPGSVATTAEDISFDGATIVGGAFFDESLSAYRWTSSGGMQDLGVIPGGFGSVALGLSSDGNVVTGIAFDADFNTHAFRWTSADGMVALGTVPGGTSSEGRRVSNNGSTIIGVANSPDGDRAFAWTSSGGMQSLGLLSPDHSASSAWGVNGNGSVIAGVSGSNAVIWTNGIAQDLGMLPGATSAIAYALSDDGSLVGGYSFFGQNARATLWSQSLGLVDLNDYLPTLGIDLTGWTLQYTRDISFDGTTIVGDGLYNGEIRGWVVTVPNPGAAGLLAISGLFAVSRRRRRN